MYTEHLKRSDNIVEEIHKAIGISTGFAATRTIPGTDTKLLMSSDGVGTKIKLAVKNNYATIGQDLVAMCVNDIIAAGGVPKYFQDYIGMNKIDPEVVLTIVNSINNACNSCGVVLTGGETAELDDTYIYPFPELVGFAVGFSYNQGAPINSGDIIVGLPSNGVHSNGYTVVNKVAKEHFYELLAPTKIYREVVDVYWINPLMIKAAAHITGGGLESNIKRSMPLKKFHVDRNNIEVPEIFKYLQEKSGYNTDQMFSIFNMGIGMTLVINKDNFYPLSKIIGYEPIIIGVVL